MESSSAHRPRRRPRPLPTALLALVTFPPECRLWIGRLGCRSALFPEARGGRGHAPYVRTLGFLRGPRDRRPEGRRAAVRGAAMVLSSRAEPTETWRSRPWRWGAGGAGRSFLRYLAGALQLPSFRLSGFPAGTFLESSAEKSPRPASGSLIGPGRRSWASGVL